MSAKAAGLRLGSVFGIELRIDMSWLIIFALISLSLSGYLSKEVPGFNPAVYWGAALVCAVLFFSSILAHEMMHSLVARTRGLKVRGITLFIFGGVASIEGEPKRPSDEFWIAVVGPLCSAVIGGAFLGLYALLPGKTLEAEIVNWIGSTNLALAVFNLLPGFPLDGGRLFRAAAWSFTGDFKKATRYAVVAGSTVAYSLIIGGLFLAVVAGALINGLWLAFIGWFLLSAARQSLAEVQFGEVLKHLKVREVMQTDCPTVRSSVTVSEFVHERVLRSGRKCFMVSDNGSLKGLVTLHEVKELSQEAWPQKTVGEIMVPADQVRRLTPEESLLDAVQKMEQAEVDQMPVVEDEHLVGVLTREDVVHAVAVTLELQSK